MSRSTIIKWTIALSLSGLLFSCAKESELAPVEYSSIDKITRLELSPNGPVLLRNGVGELRFYVKAFYVNDEKEGEKTYLQDRLPLDKIEITSSDQQVFTADKGYTTTSSASEITFTAKIGSVVSPEVKVELRDAPAEKFSKIRVPVLFKAFYLDREKHYTNALNKELLNKVLARANKVFSNQLFKSPSGWDTGIEFYLEDLTQDGVNESNSTDLEGYIKDTKMSEAEKYLTVWVLSSSLAQSSGMTSDAVAPVYPSGKTPLPGLGRSFGSIRPVNAGIFITYEELYHSLSVADQNRFEMQLGRFYGLLPTGKSNITSANAAQDFDYCDDTYSYSIAGAMLLKSTPRIKDVQPLFFKSYNIMDDYSTCTTISVEQARRIRQVIEDCPYRQQGK